MKKNVLLALVICFATTTQILADDTEVEPRLRNMDCLVPVKTDDGVLKRIKSLLRARKDTEKMIGRSSTFFPIFDKQLHDLELPADLKYITCLETELNNSVVSTAKARGIWQLMPDVHEEFGLRVDASVDERLDLYRGTEAALKDLKRMFKAYDNWEMTLAGYNCGIGRLGSAIKRAKSKEFQKVKKFLPSETQVYNDKFVAFTYIMKNYRHHGLHPSLPPIDVQCVGAVKVFSYLQLSVVANITSLPYEFIKELNPQFVEGYVPESSQGYNVILPRRVMSALQDYAANPDAQQQAAMHFAPVVVDETLPTLEGDPSYYLTNYMVGDGETLENIADLFNVGVYNIQLWNHLDSDKVEKGKELILYLPRVVPKRV